MALRCWGGPGGEPSPASFGRWPTARRRGYGDGEASPTGPNQGIRCDFHTFIRIGNRKCQAGCNRVSRRPVNRRPCGKAAQLGKSFGADVTS